MDFDADRFFKDVESIMKGHRDGDAASDDDFEEGSSSDLDFGKFRHLLPFPSIENIKNES